MDYQHQAVDNAGMRWKGALVRTLPAQTSRPASLARHQPRHTCMRMASAQTAMSQNKDDKKSNEYSKEMQSKMGGILTYRHEDGMNFAHIMEDVIVGSCLQTPEDLDRLVDQESVGAILCLQQDSDMQYFSLDIAPILDRVKARGDVEHIRYRINDFDGFSLRTRLPGAAAVVAQQRAKNRKVYIHCTAGMGRAPATCLAYMYWYRGFTLEDAFAQLRSVRPCNPRLQAIREATCDLLIDKGKLIGCELLLLRNGYNHAPQVAGLDAGWGQRLQMQWDHKKGHFVLQRQLPAGKFPFKLVYGDRWTLSADHPTLQEGDNVNNYLEVLSTNKRPEAVEARSRLLAEGGNLTEEERCEIQAILANGEWQ